MPLLIPNIVGVLSGAFCVSVYQKYAEESPLGLYSAAAAIVAFAAACAVLGNLPLLGLVACGLSVFLMGAPLVKLKTVIQEKSTASIPFTTSMAGWLNSLSWLTYGLLIVDNPMVKFRLSFT